MTDLAVAVRCALCTSLLMPDEAYIMDYRGIVCLGCVLWHSKLTEKDIEFLKTNGIKA